MDLVKIRQAAREAWRFDGYGYPTLKGVDDAARRAFAIKHVVIHLSKLMGQVSATIEPVDHGYELDARALGLKLSEMIVAAIQCADIAGIPHTELESHISAWQSEALAKRQGYPSGKS